MARPGTQNVETVDRLAAGLSEIIAKRREQVGFRLTVMLVMGVFFACYSTLPQMIAWAAVYSALQVLEFYMMPHKGAMSRRHGAAALALLSANSVVFGFPAVLWGLQGGSAGLVSSTYLLAGSVLNTVLTTRNCQSAFAASLWPFLGYSAVTAILAGGPTLQAPVMATVATGGAMLGVCSISLWRDASATRRSELLAQASILKGEVELKAAVDAAQSANQAKSDFLANMSHEIRTPLNGVVALADILAQADLPDQQREMAQIIRSSGVTLQRLLSDILDVARIEAGKMELEIVPFHLGDAARDVAGLSQLRCEEKGLQLHLQIAPELDRFVGGDATRVRQVLTNLLSNAVKFTSHGEIRLVVEPLGAETVRLAVSDTGIGFARAEKARVLGRFEQADSSITRRFGGSGLGLSICSDLARLMGGALDCESEPGVGSRFWLDIPLPAADAPLPAATAPVSAAAERGLRVLMADDHPTNRKIVQLMLDGSDMDLTMTENGEEAVRLFCDGAYDIVLMDMQMPVMDGVTAIRAIRRREAALGLARSAVVMLTANALPDHVASAIAAGADVHLAKPFTVEQLFGALSAALHEAEATNGSTQSGEEDRRRA